MAMSVTYLTAGGNEALRTSASFSIFFQLFLIDRLCYQPRLFLFAAAAGWLVGWLAGCAFFPSDRFVISAQWPKMGIPRDAMSRYRGSSTEDDADSSTILCPSFNLVVQHKSFWNYCSFHQGRPCLGFTWGILSSLFIPGLLLCFFQLPVLVHSSALVLWFFLPNFTYFLCVVFKQLAKLIINMLWMLFPYLSKNFLVCFIFSEWLLK